MGADKTFLTQAGAFIKHQRQLEMLTFPNAKINLGLNIVARRPDGYHNIETIFYPIPVKDALEITPAPTVSFHQTGISIEGPTEKNLVIRALRLLESRYDIPPMEVHLLKQIPFGAGLGGGSADAAFMIRLVNDYANLHLSIKEMEQLAAQLGADCPFFVRNQPVFATGIGDQFTPIELSLAEYHLCLVKPDIMVSTPQAYAKVTPRKPEHSLLSIIHQPINNWKNTMVNDFESSVFTQFPAIGQIKEQLYTEGALYASMSGSGSSVFGLFEHPTTLAHLFPNCFVWEGKLN